MASPQHKMLNQIHYQSGQIVNQLDGYSYRKYIGKTAEGYFVLQDFYDVSHKKMTDPFMVTAINPTDFPYDVITLSCSEDVLYEGIYSLYAENGLKKTEHYFANGKLSKVLIINEFALNPEEDSIFLDAENLAEGAIIDYYNDYICIYLQNILTQPIVQPFFDEDYNIVANDKIYDLTDYKTEVGNWSHAAYILFDIVNQQLSKSEYTFYAFGIDNDLGGMLLTEKGYRYFQQKSRNKRMRDGDYPYLPVEDLVWY